MGRPRINEETVQQAKALQDQGKSIRSIAKELDVGATTLRRYLPKKDSQFAKRESVQDLRFFRVYDFRMIPRYLFEQQKGRQLNVDILYKYGQGIAQNPLNLLFVAANKEYKIKGVLWATLNPLSNTILVQTISVDPMYQNHGEPLKVAHQFLSGLQKELGFKNIEWLTSRPRAFERLGAKRSNLILMEV